MDELAPRHGERVLDIGSGPGDAVRAIARRVGTAGHVLGVDLSPRMVTIAKERASQERNVEFDAMDATHLALPDASFDAVSMQFALHVCEDPDAVIVEARRVIRPGGRFVVAIPARPDVSPFARALDALAREIPGSKDMADPFALAEEGVLREKLSAAGFVLLSERRIDAAFLMDGAALQRALDASPLGTIIAALPPEVAARARKILAKEFARSATAGVARVDAPALLCKGWRP